MRINQNIAAFNAYRNLNNTQSQQASSLEKLSSGFRINRAADDASGLVNSENLRSQVGGLKVASRNAQDAISLVQTAEGAQTEVHSILQRMRDLAVQSGNLGTNDEAALKANQDEMSELVDELDRIAEQTQFGTKEILSGTRETFDINEDTTIDGAEASFGDLTTKLNADLGLTGDLEVSKLDDLKNIVATDPNGDTATLYDLYTDAAGEFDETDAGAFDMGAGSTISAITSGQSEFTFQVGANATQQVDVTIEGVKSSSLGVAIADDAADATDGNGIWIGEGADSDNIDAALNAIDDAIGTVSENRATLGAFQNRMESTIRNVGVAVENLSAAESRIRDTDMADEMVNFTRSQILSQAGTAMLAQANQVPQSVLSLLQ